MSEGPRYAIYFVPASESAIYRFGSAILGYDCHAGADVPFPTDLDVDSAEWATLTHEPRRYGFHATLKAPFYLSPACGEPQLTNALENFVAFTRLVPTIVPTVRVIGNFIALVPHEPSPSLEALAADCVTIFDAFRAPISPQERARRVAAGLSHRQIANLDRWGYPHLFDDFRFHMTLTGPVAPHRRDATLALLSARHASACGSRPVAIDRLALLRQDHGNARFRVMHQAKLNG